ncbi:inverse autotransporter beta domain-containing protein [Xenorhabdus sp. BG5]|uniref:inverse autotransporter beta domain-containing protein n=1 Tax=Xenorhabdus sp. BG5 TaxID=2782014 RepID=UPI00188210C9|nr:inverse autotransporter beta domain-containing protein [Xenorhabdus sp. BG5]MBE8595837.1 inverse autotransporter beta domain-containing protein [Xenorhabdus sp. BG5]
MAGNILSSSPSELAEQAKSYAIGQFNNTVSSGAQKWLSQFGTVRINFGFDKKGALKNNSFDLLLPLYDNKVDWLFFSQLGYRNKDSRDTMNVGLGGRYFSQNWMYGLNTFYDYDLTGKNQRLGLGGEIGGDYIKLSANTYYRLTNWKDSRNFVGYYERPANGYDINGEFFLPVYPHLGAKLTYEQYFGDNVTLFNRDTKQKNPNLAKLGLTYTPVPLFTLGVDYKRGGSGHSETQFLANFNYKLGVPLSVQLSPENVAAARTLAGSRYDLVERNNHIVLEHQKKPIAQLSLPETIVGYSQEQHEITVKLSSNDFVKQIHWTTNEDFEKNGGKFSSHVGHTIKITLPTYLSGDNQNNNYPIYALAELEDGLKSAPVAMRVIVRPFMLKKQEGDYFTPAGPLLATGDKKDGYTFNPVITFDTAHGTPIKNTTISHVQWITDPKIGTDTGLQLLDWETSDAVALDEKGHFKRKPVLISSRPHKDVKVYLQLNSQPPQLVGEVSFDKNPASFHVDKVEVLPAVPSQVANGSQTYTYSAVVLDSDNHPVKNQKIANVNWSKDKNHDGLIWNPLNGEAQTNGDGKLTATLASTVEIKDITVSLAIGSHKPVLAEQTVSFTASTAKYHIHNSTVNIDQAGSLIANGKNTYTYTAVIIDSQGNKAKNQNIANVKWSITRNGQDESHNKNLIFNHSGDTTNGAGQLTATLASTVEIKDVTVSLSIEGQPSIPAQPPVTFTKDTQDYRISGDIQVSPSGTLTADGAQKYTYTAAIVGIGGKLVRGGEIIHNATWKIEHPANSNAYGLVLDQSDKTIDGKGQLTATLTSIKAVKGVVVSLTVGKQPPVKAKPPVDFKSEQVSITPTPPSPILVGENYTLTVNVKDATGNNPEPNKQVNWILKNPNQKGVTLSPTSSTTRSDGRATTTLTSTQAQTVTVEASVEGVETAASVDVEFKWPTIHKPTVAEKTGTVPADGDKEPQHAYHYTAHVVGADGKTPYTGQEIKFKWRLKSQAGGTPQNTWLSEKGEVTAQSDGTLKVQLLSSEKNPVVTGAIVCLAAVDEKSVEISETEQCADPVDFEAENLKIVSLDVAFDPKHPIKGGSSGHYTYTAKVVKADGKTLPDGYKVDANWILDPAPENYNGQKEWKIEPNNIVKNGQITAILSSQVGIGDINNGQVTDGLNVKLEVPAGRGKTTSNPANQQVAFDVVSQPAGIVVYTKEADNVTIKKSKIFEDQLRPSNAFGNMYAQLYDLSIKEKILDKGGEIISTEGFGSGINDIGSIDLTTGEITLGTFHKAKVDTSITIKRTNKAKYAYNYSFFIKKYIQPASRYPGVMKQDSEQEDISCQDPRLPTLRNINELDVGINGTDSYSLQNEFSDSYSWGLLDYITSPPPVTPNILGKYSNNSLSNSGNFIYNTQENKQVVSANDSKGYVLCVGSYFSY